MTTIKQVQAQKKATNKVASQAKSDIRGISPFYFVNQLNKLAKRNEFCDNTNLSQFKKTIEREFNCKGFDVDILHKINGEFCNMVKIPTTRETQTTIIKVDTTTYEGLVVITRTNKATQKETQSEYIAYDNDYMFVPITKTLVAYLNAYKLRLNERYNGQIKALRLAKQTSK